MEIAQTTPANPIAAPSTNPRAETSSDFETFLLMLTTQMQNQDPLNPIESADFAVQLATFSGVEQQVKTNDLLGSLAQQMGVMGLSQLSGWIGMEARVAAPTRFDGSPITLAPDFPSGASGGTLVVRDETGAEVQRLQLSRSDGTIDWAGVSSEGAPLPPGTYSFELETVVGDSTPQSTMVEVFAKISEARMRNGETVVVLQGGQEVPASSISALRAPTS